MYSTTSPGERRPKQSFKELANSKGLKDCVTNCTDGLEQETEALELKRQSENDSEAAKAVCAEAEVLYAHAKTAAYLGDLAVTPFEEIRTKLRVVLGLEQPVRNTAVRIASKAVDEVSEPVDEGGEGVGGDGWSSDDEASEEEGGGEEVTESMNRAYKLLWGKEKEDVEKLASGKFIIHPGSVEEVLPKLAALIERRLAESSRVTLFDMAFIDPFYLDRECLYDKPEVMDLLLTHLHTVSAKTCVLYLFTSSQRMGKVYAALKRSKHWAAEVHPVIFQYGSGKRADCKIKGKSGRTMRTQREYAVLAYHYDTHTVKYKKNGITKTRRERNYYDSKVVYPTWKNQTPMVRHELTWFNLQPPSKYQRLWASFEDEKPLRPQAEKNPDQFKVLLWNHLDPKTMSHMHVLDMCSGSAAGGLACLDLDIHYTGIDKDAHCNAIAQQRLLLHLSAKMRRDNLQERIPAAEITEVQRILGLTCLAGLSNAPPGSLETHMETQQVEIKEVHKRGVDGKPVGKGLFGQRTKAGPTGVTMFGTFCMATGDAGNTEECVGFKQDRLSEVKMLIAPNCPGFYINDYRGLATGPNVKFVEADVEDLTPEDCHRLVEVVALRPIKKGEQWLACYGKEYRWNFADDDPELCAEAGESLNSDAFSSDSDSEGQVEGGGAEGQDGGTGEQKQGDGKEEQSDDDGKEEQGEDEGLIFEQGPCCPSCNDPKAEKWPPQSLDPHERTVLCGGCNAVCCQSCVASPKRLCFPCYKKKHGHRVHCEDEKTVGCCGLCAEDRRAEEKYRAAHKHEWTTQPHLWATGLWDKGDKNFGTPPCKLCQLMLEHEIDNGAPDDNYRLKWYSEESAASESPAEPQVEQQKKPAQEDAGEEGEANSKEDETPNTRKRTRKAASANSEGQGDKEQEKKRQRTRGNTRTKK